MIVQNRYGFTCFDTTSVDNAHSMFSFGQLKPISLKFANFMPRAVQEKKMLCAPPAFQSLHALLEDALPCRTFRDLRLEIGKCESHSILPLHGQRAIITNLLVAWFVCKTVVIY
jgi:hypothetical protein